MKMIMLAFRNFKSSVRIYMALIISLAFTIAVYFNFQNMIYSNMFASLGDHNKEFTDMIIQTVSVVLICFSFFFIWYSTNIFLTKQKREFGIYIFMGLTNQNIAKLYIVETISICIVSLVLGILSGVAVMWLFQMIVLAISDIAIDVTFQFRFEPVIITVIVFMCMYLFFVGKGYWNILRSSVLNMISAVRQNEYVKQKRLVLVGKSVLGIGVLGIGYYLAVKGSGMEVMGNILAATILVIVGVYLLFGGLLPFVFQALAQNKAFLYQKERCLWVNQVVFRMKKNYRTYAMVCVLVLCSVTALATGLAMKNRYDNMIHFEHTYTFQFLTNQTDVGAQAEQLLKEVDTIACQSSIPVLMLEENMPVLAYSNVKELAKQTGMEFSLREPTENEVIEIQNMILVSFYTQQNYGKVTIYGKEYQKIDETMVPYLGNLQRIMNFYIVSDTEYQRLCTMSQEIFTYNYKLEHAECFEAAREALSVIPTGSGEEGNFTARVAKDPNDKNDEWIKIFFPLCFFMFLVFIFASVSVMFMKLSNDAFEERERYLVMRKLGFAEKTLEKSISKELGTAYILPFIVMVISAYFSVHALERVMHENFFTIYWISITVVLAFFFVFYRLSVSVYSKNIDIDKY
jgi:putative ABC transport system permease protein